MDPPHRSYSAFARVARLTRKELSEILRDRRTIVTLVAMPLLLYPLLSVAFLQFAWVGKADASRGAAYVFGFVGVEEAQVFLARFRQGDDELRRRQAKEGPDPQLDSRVATEPELQEALRAGMIDLLVRVPGAEKIASGAEDLAKGLKSALEAQKEAARGEPHKR